MRNRLILGLLAGVALTIALSACGGSDDDTATSDTSGATPAAQVQGGAASGGDPYDDYGAPAVQATTAPTQAAAAPSTAQPIAVKAGDYFFEPKELTAVPGTIAVMLANDAERRDHTFAVKNQGGSGDLFKSPEVSPGQTATLEFTIMEEGTYEIYCSLPGHASRGQRAMLTVKRS